ncbi:DEAD/DEAH box helicase [Duncaniella freteri]|uniref:DEAD/DEAH box helicase n=1 Tax=Duncaniella freteri TaxID=2530391 RepID=UPI003F6669EA
MLVPTTATCYQHFRTFSERTQGTAVRVDYLSRARNSQTGQRDSKQSRRRKDRYTDRHHKIIGKEVRFKDLGLLIIDEEQKFGVAVKEKLKQLKTNVDTLTMSATPIPRTLQFSLMGARDLSSITPLLPTVSIITSVNAGKRRHHKRAVTSSVTQRTVFIVNNRSKGSTISKHR